MSDPEINQGPPTPYELLEYRRVNANSIVEGLASVVKDESKMARIRGLMESAETLEEGADGSFLGQKPAILAAMAYRAAAKAAGEDLLLH